MTGLVEEILRDAMNPSISASTLLRKVKVAAVKLRLDSVEAWVEAELSGYTGDLPPYRVIYGRPEYHNPYNGWQPINTDSSRLNELLSRFEVRQSIASLEEIVRRTNDGSLRMLYSPDQMASLREIFPIPVGTAGIRFSVGMGHDIVEAVRNQVLDWALALERAGVRGENFSFNAEERGRARENAVTYNIGNIANFSGNLGQGNSTRDITSTQTSNDPSVFDALVAAINNGVADLNQRQALVTTVGEMERARNDQRTFASAYGRFMTLAANHMTMVAPFVPALSAYLT